MSGVAIFVDYENLSFVLQRKEYCRLNHKQIGEDLLRFAQRFEPVRWAMMWAEWDRFLPHKRQDQSAQAILTAQGFDCLYLLRPADRSYTEQAIEKKLETLSSEDVDRIILVSGDYVFPRILAKQHSRVTLIVADPEQISVPEGVKVLSFLEVVEQEGALIPLQTPQNMEPAAFYIWMQRVLQEELKRRTWNGMSFHMLARLMVERGMCEEDVEAQFYINQAVREGFLERSETELPTGRRVLLKPTVVERASEPVWSFDEEFRWVQLVWALEIILSRNPWWEYVTFSRLREELEKWSLMSSADELQQIVEQAVEKGIYALEVEEGGAPLFRKKYKYTLGAAEDLYRRCREVPALVLATMQRLLEQNPHWHGVSFSKLLDELVAEPALQAMQDWLDRLRLKEWCNFLVAIGFLHAFRGRPRAIEGEMRDPPTLLRLVPDHAWVQHLSRKPEEIDDETALDAETDALSRTLTLRPLDFFRLTVVVEHYLHISNNDAVVAGWMPMSTLFHVMGRSLDRAFCNAVVRSAREKGIIEIRTHDPRPGQHPARGAHLDLKHPVAEEARARVLRILEMIQQMQDRSGVADLSEIEGKLRHDDFFGETEEERQGWIDLMREENLILVRTTPDIGETAARSQCTLNFRDRFVLALLESLYPPSLGVDESKFREHHAYATKDFESNTEIEDIYPLKPH
ncbi:NYN domain-containing protein [Myxococcota bacterium]|nr:NYN domain-containing protein [Myxococcota bacterium]